jgi:hypothetical protein
MSLTKATYSMIDGAPVNVLDFGAIGNGIANDAAAIQAALDTGRAVYIPQGAYLIGTPLELKTSFQLVFGDGPLSILKTATDIETMFSDVLIEGAIIRDIGFENTITDGAGGPTKFQLHFGPDSSRCNVQNCAFDTALSGLVVRDAHHAGVWFEGANLNNILDCTFNQAQILMGSTDSTIRGGFVYSFAFEYAIKIVSQGEIVIDAVRGILGGPSKGCIWIPNPSFMNKITGCYFGGTYSFMNTGKGITADKPQMLQVIGNTFHSIDDTCVEITTAVAGNIISDNTFWATDPKQNDPTNLIPGAPDIHIESVDFQSNGTVIANNVFNRFLGPVEDGMPGIGKSYAIVFDGAFNGVGNLIADNSITGVRYFDDPIVNTSVDDIVTNNANVPFKLPFTLTDVSGAGLTFTGIDCYAIRTADYMTVFVKFTYPTTSSTAGATIFGLPIAPPNPGGSFMLETNTASVTKARLIQNEQYFILTSDVNVQQTNATCSGRTFQFTATYAI